MLLPKSLALLALTVHVDSSAAASTTASNQRGIYIDALHLQQLKSPRIRCMGRAVKATSCLLLSDTFADAFAVTRTLPR